MARSKCNLVVPPAPGEEVLAEPVSGPGSATCYCRVMDRRMKRREALEAMHTSAEVSQMPASVFQVQDASDLAVLHSELLEARARGIRFEVLVLVDPGAA